MALALHRLRLDVRVGPPDDSRSLLTSCTIRTIPCGLAILFLLPDLPHNSRAFYLTDEVSLHPAPSPGCQATGRPATPSIRQADPTSLAHSQDKAYALERATRLGKKKPGKLDFSLVKRALSNWKYPCFVLGYTLYGVGCQASGYFGIYLKAQGYSVSDRNVIPSGAGLISAGESARHPTSRHPV